MTMMRTNVSMLVLLAVLMAGGMVSAFASPPTLKCYSCVDVVDAENSQCPETGFLSSVNETSIVDCAVGACVKIVTGIRVTRGCMLESEKDRLYRFHGCKTETRKLSSGVSEDRVCVCHNDNCNSGTIPSMSVLLVALASMYVRIIV